MDYPHWLKAVAASLSSRRPDVSIDSLDPNAMYSAFLAKMTPIEFAMQNTLPLRPKVTPPPRVSAQPANAHTATLSAKLVGGIIGLSCVIYCFGVLSPGRGGGADVAPAESTASAVPAPVPEYIDPVRGRKPKESEWDGICPEANNYLKSTMHDYDSLKIVTPYKVVTYGTDAWAQRIQFRAKNGFGAYRLYDAMFVIKDGVVTDMIELD